MSVTIGPMIVESSKRFRGYAERLANGVQSHQFARRPTWGYGGPEINANHAAWAFGHLSLYFRWVVEMCGQKAEPLPAGFEELFKDGTQCVDDPSGATYPPMAVVLATFFKGYDAALAALEKSDDGLLTKPPTDEKVRANWKTTGARCMFMMNTHVAMHLGQVSTWRRCMGMPPA
ncbi:MAG: DinB family protein [Phycisphaerales bacterium]